MVVDDSAPAASAETPIEAGRVTVVATTASGPWELAPRDPEPIHEAIADHVLEFLPPGARLQYGPGQLGTALLRRIRSPRGSTRACRRGAGPPGTPRRITLCHLPAGKSAAQRVGRRQADPARPGLDYSHDKSRLSREGPFVAVDTAIEIDPFGQINVEGVNDSVVGGIGGHPDYCDAAD